MSGALNRSGHWQGKGTAPCCGPAGELQDGRAREGQGQGEAEGGWWALALALSLLLSSKVWGSSC